MNTAHAEEGQAAEPRERSGERSLPGAFEDSAFGCPQWRGSTEHRYAVAGYCLLSRPPGFMLPSIAEVRMYCTTDSFAACPWFPASAANPDRPEAA
jgi:hypothetical protein